MANTIFRGPVTKEPTTVNLPVAGAYLPGIFVSASLTALTVLTTAADKRPLLLGNRRETGQDLAAAYASGDTGEAFHLEVGLQFQARMAAATYTYDQPLTIAANGYLAAAATDNVVVAHFTGAAGAYLAGALADVTIVNSYAKA